MPPCPRRSLGGVTLLCGLSLLQAFFLYLFSEEPAVNLCPIRPVTVMCSDRCGATCARKARWVAGIVRFQGCERGVGGVCHEARGPAGTMPPRGCGRSAARSVRATSQRHPGDKSCSRAVALTLARSSLHWPQAPARPEWRGGPAGDSPRGGAAQGPGRV